MQDGDDRRLAGARVALLLFATLAAAVMSAGPAALAQEPPPPKVPADGAGSPPKADAPIVDGERGRALDAIVAGIDAEAGGVSGVVLVAHRGKILLAKGYGVADATGGGAAAGGEKGGEAPEKPAPASPGHTGPPPPPGAGVDSAKGTLVRSDAPVEWASVSKQFTAAAVLRLVQAKKLGLDDPISKHLAGVPKEKAKVTIRSLLDHTSGIEAGFRNEWTFDPSSRESLVKLVVGLPMTSKPGEAWAYSNSSYCLAAAIVEKVSGRPFEDFCETELFRPAGMTSATFIGRRTLDVTRVPKDDRGRGVPFAYGNELTWAYRGCGGVVATTRDMLAWDRALRGDKVLTDASKKELFKPHLQNYALGWTVLEGSGGVRLEHGGAVGKTRAYFLRSPSDDVTVAFVFTCVPSMPVEQIAEMLYRGAKG